MGAESNGMMVEMIIGSQGQYDGNLCHVNKASLCEGFLFWSKLNLLEWKEEISIVVRYLSWRNPQIWTRNTTP